MAHQRSTSADSLSSILSCKSDAFSEVFRGAYTTAQLVSDVEKSVLEKHREYLDSEVTKTKQYSVYKLLKAMLRHAPEDSGRRYVAVVLQIAGTKGRRSVVEVAEAWMDHMFLPMLSISKAIKAVPSSSQTPTLNDTGEHIEAANRAEQSTLRQQLRTRENYQCAITGAMDRSYVDSLEKDEKDAPAGPRYTVEAAHIIPLLLNNFQESTGLRDATLTWDMLRSWTSIDFKKLVGPKIISPSNAILMTSDEHRHFGGFQFYLDKEAYPNNPLKYRARGTRNRYTFTNGQVAMDVEFRSEAESGVPPPNPEFLRVHATFARVLYMSGAAEYFDKTERDTDRIGALRADGESNMWPLLLRRLAIHAY